MTVFPGDDYVSCNEIGHQSRMVAILDKGEGYPLFLCPVCGLRFTPGDHRMDMWARQWLLQKGLING